MTFIKIASDMKDLKASHAALKETFKDEMAKTMMVFDDKIPSLLRLFSEKLDRLQTQIKDLKVETQVLNKKIEDQQVDKIVEDVVENLLKKVFDEIAEEQI
jgi:gas vesicle protein